MDAKFFSSRGRLKLAIHSGWNLGICYVWCPSARELLNASTFPFEPIVTPAAPSFYMGGTKHWVGGWIFFVYVLLR